MYRSLRILCPQKAGAGSAKMRRLKELLHQSRKTTVFTGAGVSTLSGIRDFRGANGVYNQPWKGYQVEDILSIDCFISHPELFYEWAQDFIYRADDFQPSAVHLTLAGWEQQGLIDSIYTQNIDNLHQRAGSRKVYEVHGGASIHHCLKCGASSSYDEIYPVVMSGTVPRCTCGGVIKPDIVFYGENLDEDLLRRAYCDFGSSELVIVLGSSLTVYPAAELPMSAARSRVKTVICNAQPTQIDDFAVLKYDDLAALFSGTD
ncbi:MAG: Sir2 family NAD-dependent protein deacetylase, partial [Lentisphaeria bacterium]|nr:Sir2 family NAD-dependent protein deacetylase [Lentisphaeria bacterium]